jgi:hypothetical protein
LRSVGSRGITEAQSDGFQPIPQTPVVSLARSKTRLLKTVSDQGLAAVAMRSENTYISAMYSSRQLLPFGFRP